MSSSIPKTQKTWTVQGENGFESLKLDKAAKVPVPDDYEVLVRFHAVSLNYRDLIISKGTYPFKQVDGVIPGSDGAGEVVKVGAKVTRFKVGDKAVTLFNQAHLAGSLDPYSFATGLGGAIDGTLRQYGTFHESGLVHSPPSLTYLEASTLPCAAVTAWNALFGLTPLRPGQVVLTQGTGGVSIFAIQFAKAAGATVIATTSSPSKSAKLKALGADYVINYNEVLDWGKTARSYTEGGKGVDLVVEVGGPKTMKQSLESVRIDGVVCIIGFVGGTEKEEAEPGFLECLSRVCTVRGVFVGSRGLFEEMNSAIEANKIKPVVDEKVFELDDLKEAYQYMWDQKHLGKLTVRIN